MRGLSWLLYCLSICMLFACVQHAWIGQVTAETWQMAGVSLALLVVLAVVDAIRAVTR